MAATLDEQGRPIITTGKPAATFLCADLQQVRSQNGSYDIRRKSDLVVVGNTSVEIKEIETRGA